MNRKLRRGLKRVMPKGESRENWLHKYFKILLETIIEKIKNDSELIEDEPDILTFYAQTYFYRAMPRSYIVTRIKENDCPHSIQEIEIFVEVFFEVLNPIMETQLGEKIIKYWDNMLFDSQECSVKDIEKQYREKVPFLMQQEFKKQGIKIRGIPETRTEFFKNWNKQLEEKHSCPTYRDAQIKFISDNLPDTEIYLEYINEHKHSTTIQKEFAETVLALNDMLRYLEYPYQFKDQPNYVKFLEALKNVKHPTIEELLEISESRKNRYQNPVVLNEDKVYIPPNHSPKIKYKRDPNKR